jgi:hypothetical protein
MFHRVSLLGVTAAVTIFLSSCGGGGSSSAPPPPVVVVPPSVPTPPPPSTSPPSPTYDTITAFDRDRSFSDFGVRLETLTSGGQTTTVSSLLQENLGEVGFNFFANPRRYSVFYERETESFSTLSAVPGDFSGESFSGYTDAPTNNNFFSSFVRANRTGELYVGQVRWANSITSFTGGNQRSDRNIVRFFSYGISTVPTDLPTSGSDLYQFTFAVNNPSRGLLATMDLRINWQTGEMIGVGRLPCPVGQTCPIPPAGDVTINAQFDGNGRFQGSIGGPTGYRGAIVGRFYGPRAIEIGGVMKVAGGGIDEAIGSFTARASGR